MIQIHHMTPPRTKPNKATHNKTMCAFDVALQISMGNTKQGWGLQNNFPHSLIFQNHQNSAHLLSITFIFDRCHCSSAAVTPVKYECD